MAEMVNLGMWCLLHNANWIRYSKSIDASENSKNTCDYLYTLSVFVWLTSNDQSVRGTTSMTSLNHWWNK